MKTMKRSLLLIILILNCIFISACWNYREIEQMAIVMGLAVDKGSDEHQFLVTAEIINPKGGREEKKQESVTIEATGDTIFDAIRQLTSLAGRKMYWSHAKVAIVSREIAATDILPLLDWVSRDQQARGDMWLLVSEGATAGEILKSKPKLESSISMQLDTVFRSQKYLTGFPSKRMYQFIDDMGSGTINPVLSAIKLLKQNNEMSPTVLDTVVFKKDKMVGLLDHEESKALLFVQNSIKDGLYKIENVGDKKTSITLEILGSKTTVKPIYSNGKIVMKIDIKPRVSISEISTTKDVLEPEGVELIKGIANKKLESDSKNLIEKVQKEYKSDIFGFGKKVKDKYPELWRKIEKNWDETFEKIEAQVSVDFQIEGSSTLKKPLKVAD